ncbi:MAG: anthranilate phosphoribosyltransferase [Phycisphaerae bacterium]
MSESIETIIDSVCKGYDLDPDEAARIFNALMAGHLADNHIEHLLTALADKGETVEEIVGAARAMRQHVTRIACDKPDAIDTCGTGGDGISTFNVSTAAAIVAAGAGAKVAKHGNKSNTRKSGSAEVLRALGVNIDAPPEVVARCIHEAGVGFLFAASLHPAMKHVVAIRRKIGRPTIFNLLGPLTNPAFVTRQVVGVPRPDLMETIARALQQLGSAHALVVHGSDGLCDLTITGSSRIVELRDGQLTNHTIHPEDFGLSPGPLDALRIDDPKHSAEAIRAILNGETGPRRDHTLLNAAAALRVANVAKDLKEGVQKATVAIDNGNATRTLEKLITFTTDTNENKNPSGAVV